MTDLPPLTKELWTEIATKAALEAGMDVTKFLSGAKPNGMIELRWALWKQLKEMGYSGYAIGNACGFDPANIYIILKAGRGPVPRNYGERERQKAKKKPRPPKFKTIPIFVPAESLRGRHG